MLTKLVTFVSEARLELKKVAWTPLKELCSSTGVVICSVIALAVYIFVISKVLDVVIQIFLKLAG